MPDVPLWSVQALVGGRAKHVSQLNLWLKMCMYGGVQALTAGRAVARADGMAV